MNMYNIIKALIKKGKTDSLEEKIDTFYVTNKLTKEQYNELINLLPKGE